MNFIERGISPACFHGCPDRPFQARQQAVEVAAADVVTAQAAGVSEGGVAALGARTAAVEREAQQLLDGAPQGGPGPWHVTTADVARLGLAGRAQPRSLCCRTDAYEVANLQPGTATINQSDIRQ